MFVMMKLIVGLYWLRRSTTGYAKGKLTSGYAVLNGSPNIPFVTALTS